MRNLSQPSFAAGSLELVPQNYFVPLNLYHVFGRNAPVEIDVGCGDGAFLAALASQEPEHDFLGIERLFGRVQSACRRLSEGRIGNTRILRVESSYAIRYLIPSGSVAAFYLNFPDPWPKRRHQWRRIVNEEFFKSVHRALLPGGVLRIATDQVDYFNQIQRVSSQAEGFVADCADLELPPTTFEKRFRHQRVKVHQLVLRKISAVR